MLNTKLKPCLFCGCKTVRIIEDNDSWHFVYCPKCCAKSGRAYRKNYVIAAWNKRTEEAKK